MTTPQHLRQLADRTGLDGIAEALREAASHIEKLEAAQNAEPFGYFRAQPFGWEQCAESDEGAIALYEHPPFGQQPFSPDWANYRQGLADGRAEAHSDHTGGATNMVSQKQALRLMWDFNRYFTSSNDVDVPERITVKRDEWRVVRDAVCAALSQPA